MIAIRSYVIGRLQQSIIETAGTCSQYRSSSYPDPCIIATKRSPSRNSNLNEVYSCRNLSPVLKPLQQPLNPIPAELISHQYSINSILDMCPLSESPLGDGLGKHEANIRSPCDPKKLSRHLDVHYLSLFRGYGTRGSWCLYDIQEEHKSILEIRWHRTHLDLQCFRPGNDKKVKIDSVMSHSHKLKHAEKFRMRKVILNKLDRIRVQRIVHFRQTRFRLYLMKK